jgi:hypothetical protein
MECAGHNRYSSLSRYCSVSLWKPAYMSRTESSGTVLLVSNFSLSQWVKVEDGTDDDKEEDDEQEGIKELVLAMNRCFSFRRQRVE